MRQYLPLEKRVKADKIKKLVKLVLTAAVLCVLCIISFPRCLLWQRIVVGIASFLLFVVFVLKSRIIVQMRDTSWEGTVTGRRVKHAANKSLNPRDHRVRLVCIWTVKREDGKTVKLKFDTDEITDRYFSIGDRISHTAGTRYPTKVAVPDENYICPMCGHPSSHPQCAFCSTDYSSVYDKPEFDESLWNNVF